MKTPALTALFALCAACGASSTPPASRTAASTPPAATASSESVASASFLEQYAATYRFRLGRPFGVRVTPDGSKVLFLRTGARSRQASLYVFETRQGTERKLLTAAQLLDGGQETLSADEKARRERTRSTARGISSFQLSSDGKHLMVPLSGRIFVYTLASGKIREVTHGEGAVLDPQLSPGGEQVAFVRAGDVYVADLLTGIERRLTRGATDDLTHGLAEFVAQEEMGRMHGTWWSPDSLSLIFQQTDTSTVSRLTLTDPADPSASSRIVPYPRVGEDNAVVRLAWVGVDGGEPRFIKWDRERFPYLARVEWRSRKAPPLLVVQSRSQQEMAVLSVDLETFRTEELWVERDDSFLNIDPSTPRWLPDGSGFLWATEGSGYWQLELRSPDGGLQHVLSEAMPGYHKVVSVDPAHGHLFVLNGPDPSQTQLYRLPLDGSRKLTQLGHQPGVSNVWFGRDHSVYVERLDALDGKDQIRVVSRRGKELGVLASAAEAPDFEVQLELVTTEAPHSPRAALIRPRNFDASLRYPVLFHVYGGPHVQTVRAASNRYRLDQWVADHGFIVVRIDGRGTPGQGRSFERAIFKKPARVPLEDHVAALAWLGERYSELDMERVGVFGWSYGGYLSAMAVLLHPEVFHAGVSGAPVTDWRHYDTHYTERYLGVPAGDADPVYLESSALQLADTLRRPLLVVHGTADDNVWFVNSLQLVGATLPAPRPAELMPLPGSTHMLVDADQVRAFHTQLMRYFDRALCGAQTSSWDGQRRCARGQHSPPQTRNSN